MYLAQARTGFFITGFLVRSAGSGHLNETPREKKKKKRDERLNRSKFRNPRKLSVYRTRYVRYERTFFNEFNARLCFEKGKVPASSRAVDNVELSRESMRTFT